MRSGRLDREITLQHGEYMTDSYGGAVYTWTDIATVRAEIVEATTEEFIRAYGSSDEAIRVFRIRFRSDVTTGNRVLFEGTVHDIKAVTEIQRRRGLELRTVSVGAS